MRTIRFRFGLLVLGCLLIAFAAGAGVVYVVHVTDKTVDRALDAQRRLDILTEMSGRIQQYGLIAIAAVDDGTDDKARLKEAENAVYTGIGDFEPEIAKAIRAADLPLDVNAMAARARPLEQVRAGFRVLVRQVNAALGQNETQRRSDLIRGAFNGFATMTGPYLFFLMQADRRGVEAGREQARAVSATLTRTAVGSVAVALVTALVLYRLISRPILAAVAEIRDAAVAIGQGERRVRIPVRNRDELGLLAAVFNRMTARLRRGEQRVAADRLALEATVAARTADLRAANEKLSEIDRSRRRFFADVSHELRTPLTVILGECEIALSAVPCIPAVAEGPSFAGATPAGPGAPPDERERSKAAFAVIRRRAQRLQRRVEDLLRVARSESGTIELASDRVFLGDVCTSALEAFEGATRRRDVTVRFEQRTPDVVVLGDFEWLRQVVEGAIDNALRHAEGATVILVEVWREEGAAFLSVSDDGPGWGVADPDELLVRFARRASATGITGHGIGLSLARWVVDKHGGAVTLATAAAPLGGARILIRLPPASAPEREAT